MTYKQALEYKAKKDWDNYLICLLESDETEATEELNLFYQSDKFEYINCINILSTIKKLVDKNNAKAQNILGTIYSSGQCSNKNFKQAFHYFTLSAEQGDAHALNNLGTMYKKGECVEQNNEKAIHYFILSMKQGNFAATQNMKQMPENEKIIYYLKIENAELKKKNEELETHIRAMPDGELYFEAQKHYTDQLSKKGDSKGGESPLKIE